MEFKDTEEGMPPMEDSIQAFVSSLVGPMLNEYQRYAEPSEAAQQQVAKQMQAVVLLYNYYHRKEYQHLEELNFLNFCRFAVVSCAKLIAYMGVIKGSNQSLSSLHKHRFTPTERMVKEACETCLALESPKAMSEINTWPTSKVAVFIVDKKERCILIYGSITKGVWSLVEKEIDGFDSFPGGTSESDKKNWAKLKEKVPSKRAAGSVLNDGDIEIGTEEKFLQLAYSAVKEQTGIDRDNLRVLSSTLVYSLTKKKTSCRLYTMIYKKETPFEFVTDREAKWVPVSEALNSVEGPLIEIVSPGNYGAATTVSYFHLRPYYNVIREWWSSKDSAQALQDSPKGSISMTLDHQDNPTHSPPTVKSYKQGSTALKVSAMIENLGNMKADSLEDPIDSNREVKSGSQPIAPGTNPARDTIKRALRNTENPLIPVKDKASVAEKILMKERGGKRKVMNQSPGNHTISVQNNSISTEQVSSPSNGRGINGKGLELLEAKLKRKVVEENYNSIGVKSRGQETRIPLYTESDGGKPQNYKSNGVHGVSFEQNDDTHKAVLHDNFSIGLGEHATSKDIDLSKASVEEISQKRDGLLEDLMTCQLHYQAQTKELHRKIAECDAHINTILRGGKNDMVLVNEIYHKTSPTGKFKIDVLINDTKRRKLFEGFASLRSSLQELDEICTRNHWLPSYTVINSSDAKELFHATVTIRGVDFELSERGELKSRDSEAKESAASYMLSTLYRMSGRKND